MPKRCDICGGKSNPTEYEGRPLYKPNKAPAYTSVRRIVLCEGCGAILADDDYYATDADVSAQVRLEYLFKTMAIENEVDVVAAIAVGLPKHKLLELKKRLE